MTKPPPNPKGGGNQADKTEQCKNQSKIRSIQAYFKSYNQTPKRKYLKYFYNAKTKGVEFHLTYVQFLELWQLPCSYCGRAISTIGIDRIDNSKGYISGNIIPCCSACNQAKSTLTHTEFLAICKKIAAHNSFKSRLRQVINTVCRYLKEPPIDTFTPAEVEHD